MKCHTVNNLKPTMGTRLFGMGNNDMPQWKCIMYNGINSTSIMKFHSVNTLKITMGTITNSYTFP